MANTVKSWTMLSRLVSIALSLIAISTAAANVALGPLSQYDDQVFDIAGLIAPFCVIIWAIVSAVLLYRKKAYHPGWDVGCDLIAWLLLIQIGAWLLAGAAMPEGPSTCLTSWPYSYCANGGKTKVILDIVICICLMVNAINHFAYFVRACRMVQAYRRSARATKRLGMELEEQHFSSQV